ncbi:MAG: alkaline phosphatase D family protein [Candidatus Sumerlaeota bacterium]|nr:alkaline phosphatase D family protein [Candidatus Sumerlaeota bacterium]
MRATIVALCLAIFALVGRSADTAPTAAGQGPYQGTGVKIGEVTPTSAIIWARLTSVAERLKNGVPLVKASEESGVKAAKKSAGKSEKGAKGDKGSKKTGGKSDKAAKADQISGGEEAEETKGPAYIIPPGVSVDKVEGAVPGAPGETRVVYGEKEGQSEKEETPWAAVDPDHDFTYQFHLSDLTPNTEYAYRVEGRANAKGSVSSTIEGSFETAPKPDDPARVVFTVVTGQNNTTQDDPEGHRIYPVMLSLKPSFFVHTGDILYYDSTRPRATSAEIARYKWQQIYGLPRQIEFHRFVPSYFEKDDHDTWQNDCWPTLQNTKMGTFTFKQGQQIFLDEVPMGDCTYRTMRWGKDLQIWLMEGRDFRSPNTMPDSPDKTIWGAKQKEWFKKTVQESDATFRVLINETPLVGPDREKKADNHANKAFATEGGELRRFIASQKNMYIANGDRHWQYVSVDPETGVREYSCGPTTDKHAGGFNEFVPEYHKYFKVCGGFLSGTVERVGGQPTLTFRHYAVDGSINHEEQLTAE